MVATDPRAAPFVLLVSTISAIWGLWEGQAYWSVLSILAVAWAAWATWWRVEINSTSLMMVSCSLAAVPAIGLVGGPTTWSLLESILAPVLLYSLALGTISPTLGASKACGPQMLAFMTFLATIAAGCFALLSLYYLDALLSTTYLSGNGDLMWPLSVLFLGALLISLAVRFSGLESTLWEPKEVSG